MPHTFPSFKLSSLISSVVADSGGMAGAGLFSKFIIRGFLLVSIGILPFERMKYW